MSPIGKPRGSQPSLLRRGLFSSAVTLERSAKPFEARRRCDSPGACLHSSGSPALPGRRSPRSSAKSSAADSPQRTAGLVRKDEGVSSLSGQMISIPSGLDGGPLSAYRAEPVGELRGALVVIHEIWGLVDHIKNVADRYAAEGYLVIAPDILSHGGVTPEVGEELNRLMFQATDEERPTPQPLMRERMAPVNAPEYAAWAVGALKSVVDYLEAQP